MSFNLSLLSSLPEFLRFPTMPSQTNGSRVQQSRTVGSKPIAALRNTLQSHTLAPKTFPDMSKNASSEYFEEYGLRVRLIRRRQRIPHARLTSELVSKPKDVLLGIVNEYAPGKTPKLIGKNGLVEWIERVETLALGPHPESKLSSTKKEDLVAALGLKVTSPKQKSAKVGKAVPRKRSSHERIAPSTEDKAIAQPNAHLPSKSKPAFKSTPATPSPPLQPPTVVAKPTQHLVKNTTKPLEVVQKSNKRKHDSEVAPTDIEQTPTKKTKTEHAASPIENGPPQMDIAEDSQAITITQEDSSPIPLSERATQDQEELPETHNLVSDDTALEFTDPESTQEKSESTSPISFPNETTLTTHIFLKNPLTSQVTRHLETFNGRTYSTKTTAIAITTSIPHGYDADSCPKCPQDSTPFLKPGNHGRGGDFTHDPDLITGRGHQVEPSDLEVKRAYEAAYLGVRRGWVFDGGRGVFLVTQRERELEGLERLEGSMAEYREKYPGEHVAHLWACGCERVGDGDESEEE